ncbi:DEAD/DEAH box helicase [Candidatus Liberibacter sp.]|uniref:DEAD/DEAH box helicase n=1 Tax=Candidatus Liberibacter sp. TaxID=34022 RepID=UPI0015F3C10E|nr:DEAD/DEAH box helicase [Candidatus Liberibacter sp.]MBA5723813.1 DEAD/DEAH box helicase [Candidatus Liberibacter sp.]
MNFSDLGLSPKVVRSVADAGYTEPTPIQIKTIPFVLQGRDVCGIAQTGTGKTASFVLPMLTILEKGRARTRMPRTLILEPTRELAAQVADNFAKYGKNYNLNIALLIGGVPFDKQNKTLERGADVLICTPGRMLDHFNRGKLLMNSIEILVIDEADRMLDMGFVPDIANITKLIPFTRQTLLFSATMTPELQEVSEQFLQNPERIEVNLPSSTAETIKHWFVAVHPPSSAKRNLLRQLIRSQDDLKNAIIFCNQKKDVANLFRSLERHGFSVCAIHGNMDQRSRMAMLHNFKEGNIQLMVASDVAARGLDIPDVGHVYNFDVPTHAENYIHRIGRTGRAGRSGKAFTFVTREDIKYANVIENLIAKKVEWLNGDLSSLLPPSEASIKRENNCDSKTIKKPTRVPAPSTRKREEPVQNLDLPLKGSENMSNLRKNHHPRNAMSPVGFGDSIPAFVMSTTTKKD